MLKSSLLEIIRTFSKQELSKFEDFVRSPFFNKKENIDKLFLHIKKYSPSYENVNLEKEKVWKSLFQDTEYNYGIMKNLIFDLNKLAEQFVAELKYAKDKFKYNEYLMTALCDRELKKIYINKYKSFDPAPDLKLIDENNLLISDHINYVYKMYYLNFFYHHQYDQNYKVEDLQVIRDSCLITNFLIQLFTAFNDVAAINNFRNTDIGNNPVTKFIDVISPSMESIIDSLKDTPAVNPSYLNIYYLMYRTFTEKTEEQYLEFKDAVFKLKDIPKSNLQDLHFFILNALHIVKVEKLNGYKETIEVLDSLIEHNAILDIKNGMMPLHVFNKYILDCSFLKDTERLRSFTDRFISKLEPELRENSKNHVNFMISFINKEYDEALNYFSLLDIPYFTLKVSLRSQKAMCLYETDNYEMFLNEFDNVKHFISNNKSLVDNFKLQLNNIYSHIKRLFNLKQNYDRYEYFKLEKDIADTYKNAFLWFNEKLEEIEKLKVKS